MAQDEVIRIELGGSGGSAKSLQDLKKEYKELQGELSKTKEGSDEYIQSLKKLGAVKDDIGDLRDTISALNPEGKVAAFTKVAGGIASGFAAAQGAAALFGAESEDLQKSLLKVQAAMAFAQGIKDVTALGDGFKVLNVIMKANPAAAIAVAMLAVGAAAVFVYEKFIKLSSTSEDLTHQYEELKKANDLLRKSIDSEIVALTGLKANEEKIIELKKEKLKLSIEEAKLSLRATIAKQLEAEAEFDYNEQALRFVGKDKEADILKLIRTKEQRDATKASTEELKASLSSLQGFNNEIEQNRLDKNLDINKKIADNIAKTAKEKLDAEKKWLDEMYAYHQKIQTQISTDLHAENIANKKRLEEKQEETKYFDDEVFESFEKNETNKANISKKNAQDAEDLEKEKAQQKEDIYRKSFEAAKGLSDLYFAHQLKKAKGNAAAELEIKKKQFKVNKAFQITMAVIDGIRSVQAALATAPPLSYVLAGLNGVLAGISIAKIASTKFEGGDVSASGGDIGAVGTPNVPAVPQPNNTVTKINDKGENESKQGEQKVYVLEQDITQKQKRITTVEESAKFG